MNKTEFLSVIYGGIKPGLIIQTRNSHYQFIGIDIKRNIEYLLRSSYKKKITENEWVAVYSELSKGKITNSQIREIVGASKTCNAGVIKSLLTKFGLATLDTTNVWIATWRSDSRLIHDENTTLVLLSRSGEIISVNYTWSKFALANGGSYELSNGVGMNYLDVCKSSVRHHCRDAKRSYDGILAVIDGSKDIYTHHYTCHSEEERRWYVVSASRFADKYTRVSHVPVEFSIQALKKLKTIVSK